MKLILASVLLMGILPVPSCGFLSRESTLKNQIIARHQELSNCIAFATSHPEYNFEEDESAAIISDEGDYFAVTLPKEDPETSQSPSQRPEYGALSRGTVVQVQVGDVSLARKAWKKRRRTGSPLLVPCSVLNADRQSMVRWNLSFLLEKFGKSQKDGIQISSSELSNKYRTFLKSSLSKQANALGFDDNASMMKELFNKKIQESYGIRLVEKDDDLFLKAPISRHKAHKRTINTPVLQFRLPRDDDHGDADTLTHTGFVKSRKENSNDKSYHFLPLSTALRVSQKDDVDTGRITEGSIHPAVVFDYDIIGDGGSPLLTLSLNPRGTRDSMKVKPDRKFMPIEHPKHTLDQLSAGDGPYHAKVVQIVPGRALVDMEVGRKVSSEAMVRVLGSLRFQDSVEVASDNIVDDDFMTFGDDDFEDDSEAVIEASLNDLDNLEDDEEDEDDDNEGLVKDLLSLRASDSFEEGTFEEGEEEEDISNLVQLNEDGSLTYSDPDSGKSMVLDTEDDEFEESMVAKSIIDKPKGFGKVEQEEPTKASDVNLTSKPSATHLVRKMLRVGDSVDVYIRSVSKQSGQFAVTTNPVVHGRKAKDLKKEGDADKRLKRLKKSLGGSLKKIYDLEGEECDGTVKATSKTGDWVYVQPNLSDLPVGIATFTEHLGNVAAGDSVRVRIAGVDEERGQLALQVLDRLSP